MFKLKDKKMKTENIWNAVKLFLDEENTSFNADIIEYLCKNPWYDNGPRPTSTNAGDNSVIDPSEV